MHFYGNRNHLHDYRIYNRRSFVHEGDVIYDCAGPYLIYPLGQRHPKFYQMLQTEVKEGAV